MKPRSCSHRLRLSKERPRSAYPNPGLHACDRTSSVCSHSPVCSALMDNKISWLLSEIDRWKTDGLVSPEQADLLRKRYDQPPAPAAESVPWGLLVFASAGAIVIGLGVILLFAYNWAEIPKAGKLALVFLALIGAHAGGIRLLARSG